MNVVKSVRLEFLRHGPRHNQLISKAMPYLALSGNNEPQNIYLPFEHREFLRFHRALRYGNSDYPNAQLASEREAQLEQVAEQMGNVLGAVPGLCADLGACRDRCDLIHLRLVFSAAELALLPFEMAQAVPGFPGVGHYLQMQTELPILMTRQIRQAEQRPSDWTRPPKILFICSDAGGPIPLRAHLDALVNSILPWVRTVYPASNLSEDDRAQMEAEGIKRHLRVCRNKTLAEIEAICRSTSFTHIHVLAHGGEVEGSGELARKRFGLVLNRAGGKTGCIGARRLASTLFGWPHEPSFRQQRPNVISLATCDSGNPGNIIFPDASLAHALHEAGVPLVVGSQYPMSFRGSIVMVETLYGRLPWGDDPRFVLHDLRMRLGSLPSEIHDWASLVAYAAFPPDFEAQMRVYRVQQIREARRMAITDAAVVLEPKLSVENQSLGNSDLSVEGLGTQSGRLRASAVPESLQTASVPDASMETHAQVAGVIKRLQSASRWVGLTRDRDQVVRTGLDERVETLRQFGGVEKRVAELFFKRARATSDLTEQAVLNKQSRESLKKAKAYYQRAAELNPLNHSVGTQYACLRWVSGEPLCERKWEWLKLAAEAEREDQKETGPATSRIWAACSLAELHVLASVQTWAEGQRKDHEKSSETYIMQVVKEAGSDSFEWYTTYYQFRRYTDWWGRAKATFRQVAAILPQVKRIMELMLLERRSW